MHIGGLLKYSLIDYPPHISCVIFTAGCNFRCPYCHNPELAVTGPDTRHLSRDEIMDFLVSRQKYLDGVVISGGEPTLHPDLGGFCADLQSMGFLVKLDTNGSRPEVIQDLVENRLVDYLAMDIKTDPELYNQYIAHQADAAALRSSVQIILESGLAHEFRTTCVSPLTTRETVKAMAELVTGADLHAFQHVQNKKVLNPNFFTGQKRVPSDAQIDEFQTIMAGYVKKAIIR
ncbi:MAG: anaerobic ribonucleoside-triphosphate reductase activating protein [Desulfobacterales bacterium]|nr:anaerobic ribonucleoside-triphosphate reductase activating protein [Desulfobacterales bacterium]